jgi:cyclic pyranopterin phosphate synthase
MTTSLPILTAQRPDRPARRPARRSAGTPRALIDSHGRVIRDLRLSVTDKCNFRCVYCMDPDVRFMKPELVLSEQEIARVARVCAGLGVQKIRLTGGEPTLRPDLTRIIARIAEVGITDLAMTTNGAVASGADLAGYRDAGLSRVTISIDSLNPARFAAITRSNASPERIVRSIRDAREAGLEPIRVNAVIVRGFNDDEVEDLAAFAREHAVDLRLIEFMPLDSGHRWDMANVVTADEMLARIAAKFPIQPLGRDHPSTPAERYAFSDGSPGRIGVIASVTRKFCGACSRLRITADGMVRPCLFSTTEYDLRSVLRDGGDDESIARFLADATWAKQAGHAIASPSYTQPLRPMSSIGG